MYLRLILVTVLILPFLATALIRMNELASVNAGEKLYEAIVETERLDYEFYGEVVDVAKTATERTRYRGRILVNQRPRSGFLTLLLVDTRSEGKPLPPRFLDRIKYQCVAIPASETVVCDATFLDAIPDPPPLVVKEGDPVHHSILKYWVIGHEIGHIVLRHGYEFAGFFGLARLARDRLAGSDEGGTTKERVTSARAQTDDVVRTLFEIEREADKFILDRLAASASASLQYDFIIGNLFIDLLQKARSKAGDATAAHSAATAEGTVTSGQDVLGLPKPPGLNPSPRGARVTLGYTEHAHPPFLWRVFNFIKTTEITYRDIKFPSLAFEPNIEIILEEAEDIEQELGYFYDGFYIRSVRQSREERAVGRLLDGILNETKLRHSWRDAFETMVRLANDASLSDQPSKDDVRILCDRINTEVVEAGLAERTCLIRMLVPAVAADRCLPVAVARNMLRQPTWYLPGDGATSLSVAHAQLTLMTLHNLSCMEHAGEDELPAYLFPFEQLAQREGSGLAVMLFPKILRALATLPPGMDKYSAIIGMRELAIGYLISYDLAFRAADTLIVELDEDDAWPSPFSRLREQYVRADLGSRVAALSWRELSKEMSAILNDSLRLMDENLDVAERHFLQSSAFEAANSYVFYAISNFACDVALANADAALEALSSKFDLEREPPNKLYASRLAAAVCVGTNVAEADLQRAEAAALARIAAGQSNNDIIKVNAGATDLLSVATYFYLQGDTDNAYRSMQIVVENLIFSHEKTVEKQLEDAVVLIARRHVPLLDILNRIPFEPSRYEEMPEPEEFILKFIWDEE